MVLILLIVWLKLKNSKAFVFSDSPNTNQNIYRGLSNQNPPILLREWRNDYQTACEESQLCVRALMKGWLLTSPNGEATFL